MKPVLASFSASVSELKKNPSALLKQAKGAPVAILNHNIPTAYLVPAATYERILERINDLDMAEIVRERAAEKENAIEVRLDEL